MDLEVELHPTLASIGRRPHQKAAGWKESCRCPCKNWHNLASTAKCSEKNHKNWGVMLGKGGNSIRGKVLEAALQWRLQEWLRAARYLARQPAVDLLGRTQTTTFSTWKNWRMPKMYRINVEIEPIRCRRCPVASPGPLPALPRRFDAPVPPLKNKKAKSSLCSLHKISSTKTVRVTLMSRCSKLSLLL